MSVSAQAVIDQIFAAIDMLRTQTFDRARNDTPTVSCAIGPVFLSTSGGISNAELYENLKNGSSLFAALTRDAHDSMEKKLIFKGGRPWSVFV